MDRGNTLVEALHRHLRRWHEIGVVIPKPSNEHYNKDKSPTPDALPGVRSEDSADVGTTVDMPSELCAEDCKMVEMTEFCVLIQNCDCNRCYSYRRTEN